MINNQEAQKQAEETYIGFLKWCKVSLYWIMAILVILAWYDFGTDTKTGSQYNGEVYAPKGVKDD